MKICKSIIYFVLILVSYVSRSFAADCQVSDATQSLYDLFKYSINLSPHYFSSDDRSENYQALVGSDMEQLKSVGFETVRLRNASDEVIIEALNKAYKLGFKVIYDFSLCKSNVTLNTAPAFKAPKSPCVDDNDGLNFDERYTQSLNQLTNVIKNVGVEKFSKVVKLIIAGEESLVSVSGAYNHNDIIWALTNLRKKLNSLDLSSVRVSTVFSLGQTQSPEIMKPFQNVLTPETPIIENINPFSYVNYPEKADPVSGLKDLANKVIEIQKNFPQNPVIVTSVGWPTYGNDLSYLNKSSFGTLNDASIFYQGNKDILGLYKYIRSCKIPMVIESAFDQPGNNSMDAGSARSHYGLFTYSNEIKTELNETEKEKPTNEKLNQNLGRFLFPVNPNLNALNNFISNDLFFISVVGGHEAQNINMSIKQESYGENANENIINTFSFKPYNRSYSAFENDVSWPSVKIRKGDTVNIFSSKDKDTLVCSNKVLEIFRKSDFYEIEWEFPGNSNPKCPDVKFGGANKKVSKKIYLPWDI